MKDIAEFLKECRVNGNQKIDTNDDSSWKLKDLLEYYKVQCNTCLVFSSFKCRKCGSENIKERCGYKVCFDCGEHH